MDLKLTHLISAQCTRDCLCSLALLFQWPLTIVFYRLKKSRLSYDTYRVIFSSRDTRQVLLCVYVHTYAGAHTASLWKYGWFQWQLGMQMASEQ